MTTEYKDWQHIYLEPKPLVAIVETICLSMLGVLLGYWFMPDAPYFSGYGFSWLMVGPMLSGLRYGFRYALNSVLLLFLLATFANQQNIFWAQGSTTNLFFGLLFIAVVVGEFRDYWHRRLKRMNAVTNYLDQRMTEISHAFNMLKHSHDRLAQLMASSVTLRDSLLSIRRQIMLSHSQNEGLLGLGLLILRSMADFGSLQSASLYAYDPENQQVNPQCIASIGNPSELNINNPVVQKALRERKTVSLKLDLITQIEDELLLVIPLVDVYRNILGIITVDKMPFRAFREDNIKLLAVLSGYIGDLLGIKAQAKLDSCDENLLYFYIQTLRCMEDANNYNIPSTILGMEFRDSQYSSDFEKLVIKNHRDLDQLLLLTNQHDHLVALLVFPLTNMQGLEQYCLKFKELIRTELGTLSSDIRYYKKDLTNESNIEDEFKLIANALALDDDFLCAQSKRT